MMIGQVGKSTTSKQKLNRQQEMHQTKELGGEDNFLFSRDPTKASFISASTLATQEEMMGIRSGICTSSGADGESIDDLTSHCSTPVGNSEERSNSPEQQQHTYNVVEAESPIGRLRIASTLLGNKQQGISYLAQYLSAAQARQEVLPRQQQQPVLTLEGRFSQIKKRPREPSTAHLGSRKQQQMSEDQLQGAEERLLESLLGSGALHNGVRDHQVDLLRAGVPVGRTCCASTGSHQDLYSR